MINVIEIEGMKDLIQAIEDSGGDSSDVPAPTSSDRGKVLGVKSDADEFEYKEISEVPDSTGANNGDVLTKTVSGVGWYPPAKELPTSTSDDEGKVLTVDSNGDVEWATPSAGGGASVYGSGTAYMNTVSGYDSQTSTLNYYAYGSDVISNDGKTMAQAVAGDMVWAGNSTSKALYIIEEYVENYSFYGPAFKLKLINNTLQHLVQIDQPLPPEPFVSVTKDISASTTSDLITAIDGLTFTGVTNVNYKVYSVLLYIKTGSTVNFSIDITGYTCNYKGSNRTLYITDSTALTNYINAVLTKASSAGETTYTASDIKTLVFSYNKM